MGQDLTTQTYVRPMTTVQLFAFFFFFTFLFYYIPYPIIQIQNSKPKFPSFLKYILYIKLTLTIYIQNSNNE